MFQVFFPRVWTFLFGWKDVCWAHRAQPSDEHPIRQGLSTWTRTANCGDCVRSNLGEGRKHLQHQESE